MTSGLILPASSSLSHPPEVNRDLSQLHNTFEESRGAVWSLPHPLGSGVRFRELGPEIRGVL